MHLLVCAYRRKDETARFHCARVVGLHAIHLWPKSFNNAAAGCSESRTRAHGCEIEVEWRNACGVWKRHLSVKRHSARDVASRSGPCGLVMRNLPSFFSGRPMMTPCDWKKDPSPSKAEGSAHQTSGSLAFSRLRKPALLHFLLRRPLTSPKKKKKKKKKGG